MLTDIVMPGAEDGLALAAWTTGHRPGLRVILSSGYSRGASRLDKAANFLQKPYSPEKLIEVIENEN